MEKEKIKQLQMVAVLYGDFVHIRGFWDFTAREMALAVAAHNAWWAYINRLGGGWIGALVLRLR